MPKAWERSEEQEEYLNALLPKLVQAHQNHRIERFKSELYEGWFTRWPEELTVFGNGWKKGDAMSLEDKHCLGTAIEKRKQQLYNYVRWHGSGKTVRSRTSGILKQFINRSKDTKRSRKNQKLELYSQKYYEMRFKDQTESDEIKAEIEALWNDVDDDVDAEGESDPDEAEHSNAGGYGGHLKGLGQLLTSFLRELQDETGWAFTIIGGGLNCEGEVQVVTSHVGKTAAGSMFPQVCNNYPDNVLQEFLAFVKVLHPIEEHLLRAQVNSEQISNMEMSQDSIADKSYDQHKETAVDTSKGYPTKNHAHHEEGCNSKDASCPSSLSLSTPIDVFAHAASAHTADAVVLSHTNAVPDIPIGDFQSVSAPFSYPPSAASSLSFEYSMASTASTMQPDLRWMNGSSPSFSTPVMQTVQLPYENLTPFSRFLVMTASNDDAVYSNDDAVYSSIALTDPQSSTDMSSDSSLVFFNSTNMADPAGTMSSQLSVPFNSASINGVNPQVSYPSSFIRGSGLASDVSGSVIPTPEPVNRVTDENRPPETNTETNQALVKSRKRSQKDEIDMTCVLPEGTTRAHKPRQMADETQWEGTAPKRSRNRKI